MRRDRRPKFELTRPLISVGVILTTWQIASFLAITNPLFLPTLGDVTQSMWEILLSKEIYFDLVATIYRAGAGIVLSIFFAVPLGLILGRVKKIYDYLEFPIDFFRSIPSSALFFLFVLFFGVGDTSKIAVVFYGCFLIILVSTVYGAKPTSEKQDRINMLRSFGANRWQVFYLSIFPDALPHIAASLRVCVSLSLVLVIVTEMFLGSNSGIGFQLYNHYLAYDIPEMYCLLIILGSVGYLANKMSILIEEKLGFWTFTSST